MKEFLVLFREPGGRADERTDVEKQNHQQNWQQWIEQFSDKISKGGGLTVNGKLVKGIDAEIEDTIHRVGTEIVGGFLLLKAASLDEAAAIVKTCPVYEFGNYAEIRELGS